MQSSIDSENVDSKLLGLIWNRATDTLSTRPIDLSAVANTKRTILQTIASQYDVFSFAGPSINRARLFMHCLQCNKSLGWHTRLDAGSCREWSNISRQATPTIQVYRFVGNREDMYRLLSFCDASKNIYAAVLYIKNCAPIRLALYRQKTVS